MYYSARTILTINFRVGEKIEDGKCLLKSNIFNILKIQRLSIVLVYKKGILQGQRKSSSFASI